MRKKAKLPKIIVVYVDYDTDGKPYYTVSDSGMLDVPESAAGEEVGVYKLSQKGKLRVTKEMVKR